MQVKVTVGPGQHHQRHRNARHHNEDLRQVSRSLLQTVNERAGQGGNAIFRSAHDLPASRDGDTAPARWAAGRTKPTGEDGLKDYQ